jgi:hypothetical protein
MKNELRDEMKNKLTNKIRNEIKNNVKNDVLFEDKALDAIVDLTLSFLMRVVSIFFDTKIDHETSSVFVAKY